MFFFSLKLIVKTKHPLSSRGERIIMYYITYPPTITLQKNSKSFLRIFVGFVNCTRQLRPSKVLVKFIQLARETHNFNHLNHCWGYNNDIIPKRGITNNSLQAMHYAQIYIFMALH